MVGDIHALCYVSSLPRHQLTIQSAVHTMVEDELHWNTTVDPDPRWREHTRMVFETLLLKPFRERGRAEVCLIHIGA